jgi:hypothetical protein
MQGVIKQVSVFEDAPTSGGRYRDTLKNIPAREAGTKKRNYLVTLFFRFKGTLWNSGQAPYVATTRELLHALGRVSLDDFQGTVLPDLDIDLLYAVAYGNDTLLPPAAKSFGIEDTYTIGNGAKLDIDVTVPFSYCPGVVSDIRLYDDMDGVCPVSLLGEQAKLTFAGVGTNLTATVIWSEAGVVREDPTISLSALLWQTEEVVKAIPRRIEVERWTGADPHVVEGDLRKLHQMLMIPEAIGTVAAPGVNALLTSAADISFKCDGDPQIDGPAAQYLRDISHVRHECALYSRATAFGGTVADGCFFENQLAILIPAQGYQKATQRPGYIRSELRGLAGIETHTQLLVHEVLRHMDARQYDREMEKEGVDPADRRDVRLVASTGPSVSMKAAGLTLGAAIGVASKVGHQKERK